MRNHSRSPAGHRGGFRGLALAAMAALTALALALPAGALGVTPTPTVIQPNDVRGNP